MYSREEIGILVYDGARVKEIARKRNAGRNLPEGQKNNNTGSVLLRKWERKVLVWLQSEMSSVRAPEPEGTNLTVSACACFPI